MKKFKLWLKRGLIGSAVLMAILGIAAGIIYLWWFQAPHLLTSNVVYGERNGQPLYVDVYSPPEPNGAAALLMVSGGWKSGPGSVRPFLFAPFLRRGYTVFAIRHISQPECLIGDIVSDMHRAVRFIRHHASEYGVSPERFGVIGGSSGGHLALMLATRGGPGPQDAEDPIDRESSAVQCVAIFYPPTDLLNLGASTENPGDGGPPKSFRKGFGPRAESMEEWKILGRELSPIYHITDRFPPTFIVHGGADTLVTVDQSERFQKEAVSAGRNVRLEIRPGKEHGWPEMILDLPRFADWFDEYLSAEKQLSVRQAQKSKK
jgi:acetyl esterase/lipase